MKFSFSDSRTQAIGGILIVLVAIVLGLTRFKVPGSAKTSSTKQNTNMHYQFPGQLPMDQIQVNVRLTTTKGDIVIQLDPAQGPLAASNFVYLVKEKYYDGIVFHRIEDWVAQVGDPQTKDPSVSRAAWGTGGPGYTIPDEKVTGDYTPGTVAMARTQAPNSAGSQIFIMKQEVPLDKVYVIFGKVISGLDIVQQLTTSDKIVTATVEAQ